jgi:hypothetical protein
LKKKKSEEEFEEELELDGESGLEWVMAALVVIVVCFFTM